MFEKRNIMGKIMMLLLGVMSFCILYFWSFADMYPGAWGDLAVGAGLIPSSGMLPGYGALLSRALFSILPVDMAIAANGVVAKLIVTLCGMLAFSMFSDMMEVVSGVGARDLRRRRIAIRVSAFSASLLLVCAEPVWKASQGITGHTVVFALMVIASAAFARLLRTAKTMPAVISLSALGLLAADSLIGWGLLVVYVALASGYLMSPQSDDWKAFLEPMRMQRTKWQMTFAFVAMFMLGAVLVMFSYDLTDGLGICGLSRGSLPMLYASSYWGSIVNSVSVVGFSMFILVGVIPCVLTTVMIARATDEDQYLGFGISVVYILAGLVAFLQLSPFDFAWVWSVFGDDAFVSDSAVLLTVFLCAISVAWGFYVFCVEAFCRDYDHIEDVLYQGFSEEDVPVRETLADSAESVRLSFSRLAVLFAPLVALLLCIGGRAMPFNRILCDIVDEVIRETLDEAKGVDYLFTDGAYDPVIRLESYRRGSMVIPISMMSGNGLRDTYIRQHSAIDMEDRVAMRAGAFEVLRSWTLDKHDHLKRIAAQVAFDVFSLNRKLSPIVYGMMVRPTGGDGIEAERSFERCLSLAERIIESHENGTWRRASDPVIKDKLLFAQFRMSVMLRLRAMVMDVAGKTEESLAMMKMSDRLNACNPSLQKIMRRVDWIRRQSGESLTSREGLDVALKRADFGMAKRYALPILNDHPDDCDANFAVGMSYYVEGQYARAEKYLMKVLEINPQEAAVINNIAMIQLKTGRYDDSLANAEKALSMTPDSVMIKDTVRQVRAAMEERRKNPTRR